MNNSQHDHSLLADALFRLDEAAEYAGIDKEII